MFETWSQGASHGLHRQCLRSGLQHHAQSERDRDATARGSAKQLFAPLGPTDRAPLRAMLFREGNSCSAVIEQSSRRKAPPPEEHVSRFAPRILPAIHAGPHSACGDVAIAQELADPERASQTSSRTCAATGTFIRDRSPASVGGFASAPNPSPFSSLPSLELRTMRFTVCPAS